MQSKLKETNVKESNYRNKLLKRNNLHKLVFIGIK